MAMAATGHLHNEQHAATSTGPGICANDSSIDSSMGHEKSNGKQIVDENEVISELNGVGATDSKPQEATDRDRKIPEAAGRDFGPKFKGDALNAWKSSLNDPNNVLQSWDPTLINPCTWFHVTCNADNSVIRVDLGNANLSGTLVPQLGLLANLQYLSHLLWTMCNRGTLSFRRQRVYKGAPENGCA